MHRHCKYNSIEVSMSHWHAIPVPVSFHMHLRTHLHQITKIKAGNTHSLALSDDGKVSVRVCVSIFVRICQWMCASRYTHVFYYLAYIHIIFPSELSFSHTRTGNFGGTQ